MDINLVMLLLAGVILSVVAAALFRLGPQEQTEMTAAYRHVRFIPVFILVNLGLCYWLRFYYELDAGDILLTIALITVLWSCAWYDFKLHIIPNRILIAALIMRFLLLAIEVFVDRDMVVSTLLSSVIAAGALFVASGLCRLLVPKSVGWGDVKLLFVTGMYLGVDKVWGAVFSAVILLFVVCVYLLITKRADRKSEIAFAPFMLFGTIVGAIITGI